MLFLPLSLTPRPGPHLERAPAASARLRQRPKRGGWDSRQWRGRRMGVCLSEPESRGREGGIRRGGEEGNWYIRSRAHTRTLTTSQHAT